ncbi:uncharacterized protein LTR77_005378 [Saxophila tyrrhenica]|uniref:Uncharacterized protein n=1 Tax=Saxophila tyrrhenica TaxID=1690608 RepID=A0AAV9P8C1_9PEZI|nr:hypothetical protein LTR77_005378 [Saxophila tyrrhenica]
MGESVARSQSAKPSRRLGILIDSFKLSTWICVSIVGYSAISWLLPRLQSILLWVPTILLAWASLDALLMHAGLRRNIWMEGVQKGVTNAVSGGKIVSASGPDGQIVVFLVGAQVNHALGIFSPGVARFVAYFDDIASNLEQRREEFGMLGASSWIADKERSASNDMLYIYYFRTIKGVNKFAQDASHANGWNWYNKFSKQHKHIALRHELYHVPAGHWSNVFLNSHRTLIGATTYKDESLGEWTTMLRSANTKRLRTLWGRMGEGSESLRSGGLSHCVRRACLRPRPKKRV